MPKKKPGRFTKELFFYAFEGLLVKYKNIK